MRKLILIVLFILLPVQVSGSPISKAEYVQLSTVLKEDGFELSKFGTKRIVVHKVDEQEETIRVGWVDAYSSAKSVKEYFKMLDNLFEKELAESSGDNYVAKCFDNPLDSSPNINCTFVFREKWALSVYLTSGQEHDFIETVKRINKEIMGTYPIKRNWCDSY